MNVSVQHGPDGRALRCAVVLRVHEDECEVLRDGRSRTAHFAPVFPSPRTERVQPGHLVALTATPGGEEVVLWRWYDAVVLDEGPETVRLWEPAHGEVIAKPRPSYVPGRRGERAYLSAGLPGAEWWVAGPASVAARDADVELDEVEALFTANGLWPDGS